MTDPSCVQGLGIGECVGGLIASCTHPLNPALHCRMALGIKPFNPNLPLLEVKAQNGVVAPDPKARHGIASPGVCGFEPGGGVVTQPACPVPRIERAQSFKRIGGSHLSGQSPATTLLERISCQGEPTAQVAGIPVQPNQARFSVLLGERLGDDIRCDPRMLAANQCLGTGLIGVHRRPGLHRSGRPAASSASSRIRQLSHTPQGTSPPL